MGEERKRQLEEDLKWAEEQRLAEEFERKEKIRKEKERVEAEKKAKEDAEKEKQRHLIIQKDLEIQAAMAEEIQWALEQKKQLEDEKKSKEDIERETANAKKRAEEADKKIMEGILQKKEEK